MKETAEIIPPNYLSSTLEITAALVVAISLFKFLHEYIFHVLNLMKGQRIGAWRSTNNRIPLARQPKLNQ